MSTPSTGQFPAHWSPARIAEWNAASLRVTTREIGSIPGCTPLRDDSGRYTGSFPSKSLCEFNNGMKDRMLHFDDGKRMTYVPSAAEYAVMNEQEAEEAPAETVCRGLLGECTNCVFPNCEALAQATPALKTRTDLLSVLVAEGQSHG